MATVAHEPVKQAMNRKRQLGADEATHRQASSVRKRVPAGRKITQRPNSDRLTTGSATTSTPFDAEAQWRLEVSP